MTKEARDTRARLAFGGDGWSCRLCQNHRQLNWTRPQSVKVTEVLHATGSSWMRRRNDHDGTTGFPIKQDLNSGRQTRLFVWVQKPVPPRLGRCLFCPRNHVANLDSALASVQFPDRGKPSPTIQPKQLRGNATDKFNSASWQTFVISPSGEPLNCG